MGNIDNRINLSIEKISAAHGTTKPRLDIELSVTSTNRSLEIQQMFSEVVFHFPKTDTHLDGPTPIVPTDKFDKINSNGTTFQPFLELTSAELDKIEQFREGGDINIELKFRLTIDRNNSEESGTITVYEDLINEEWSRILKDFDYHDTRTVKLNISANDPQVRDKLATVSAKIESAQNKHDRGDYPAAVVNCRRAIEALEAIDEIDGILDERKHSDLNSVMGNFKGFTGGLAHAEEQTNIEPAMRRDSELALGITKSCAMYVSTVIEENGQ